MKFFDYSVVWGDHFGDDQEEKGVFHDVLETLQRFRDWSKLRVDGTRWVRHFQVGESERGYSGGDSLEDKGISSH